MSCGTKSVVAVATVTIEMTATQRKELIDVYARGAAVRVAIRQFSSEKIATPDNPLPIEYRLTMAGCNNNNQVKVSTMMNAIYAVVREVATSQQVTLDGRFSQKCISRLDATYQGTEFGFLFSSTTDSLSVIIIPKIYPKSGVEIKKYCVEKNQWGQYHDGNGGTYEQLIKENATACNYIPPRPAGELIKKYCVEKDQWGEYTDGNYGSTTNLIKENATECGYIAPPKGGTLITKTCRDKDQWGTYADGFGGQRYELIKVNSTECGYVAPPRAGTLIRNECQGTTYTRIEADGTGGTRSIPVETNSVRCGYRPPPGPTPPPPTPTPPGPTPPGPTPPGPTPPPPGGSPVWKAMMLYGNAGTINGGAYFDPSTGIVRFAWVNGDTGTFIGGGNPGGPDFSYGMISASTAQGLTYQTTTDGSLRNFTLALFNTLDHANYEFYDRVPAGA